MVNTADNGRVVGFHMLCPNAGDITQGIALAMSIDCTRDNIDDIIGIHPTVGEEVFGLRYTKEENPDAAKSGC